MRSVQIYHFISLQDPHSDGLMYMLMDVALSVGFALLILIGSIRTLFSDYGKYDSQSTRFMNYCAVVGILLSLAILTGAFGVVEWAMIWDWLSNG